jgi:5-methylcytosine-specific restriction endonuclease McrA
MRFRKRQSRAYLENQLLEWERIAKESRVVLNQIEKLERNYDEDLDLHNALWHHRTVNLHKRLGDERKGISEFLSITEIVNQFDISTSTVRRLIYDGRITNIEKRRGKKGDEWVIESAEVSRLGYQIRSNWDTTTELAQPVYRSSSTRERAMKALANICRCAYCDCSLDRFHLDHVVPLARGGEDDLCNIVKTCPTCNVSKGTALWIPLHKTLYADGSREARFGGGNPRLATRVG